jgi:hypothetical protein
VKTPFWLSSALESAAPPRTSLRTLPISSAIRGLPDRLIRISKLRSSGSPARRSVASSRVMMPMSVCVTLLRWKSARRGAASRTVAPAAPASSARIGIKPIDCTRATAAVLLAASSTPSCTSPADETALYLKNGMGARVRPRA